MPRSLWLRVGIGLLFIAAAGAFYQVIAPRLQPLPVYMALPDVSLTDQDGRPFDLAQTRGKVVVLSPIYTHCPDICPLTTAKMKQIQDRLQARGWSDQVQLVTFSVDPQRDQPGVLKRFAGVYKADLDNWIFLTGNSAQIQSLIQALGLYVERVYYVDGTPIPEASFSGQGDNPPYLVNHTDRLFLVDRQGNVRALQPGSRTQVDEAMQLIQQLIQIPNGG
ncbi:MAG: SCO family protein [Anaerolineaceae bacterium]|nr:SCO family protein [Anaerolineaceae bacterium]